MLRTATNEQFWDKIARKYAADPIADMPGYERTLERTGQLLNSTSTVLELGCGTGTTALRLAPHVSRIIATDVSREMIAIAREKASAQSCGNVVFVVSAADRTSEAPGSFDAILAFNVLHLMAARPAVLQNALLMLKPGGWFVSKTPCLKEMSPLIRMAIPVAQFAGKAPYVSVFNAGELETEIAAAGFTIIERARHGSKRKDPRIFIAAHKPDGAQSAA